MRSSASGSSSLAPSPTASKKQATGCSPSRGSRPTHGARSAPPSPSSGCTRSSSAGSRPRPRCQAQRPPRCCSGRCLPQGRSQCAKSMAGRPSPTSHPIKPLTSPYDRIASSKKRSRQPIPTTFATAHLALTARCACDWPRTTKRGQSALL